MMKRLLSLALIVALSSTAGALVCQNCTDDYCTSPVPRTCDTETMCITAAITAVSSGTPGTKIFKITATQPLYLSPLLHHPTAYCVMYVTLPPLYAPLQSHVMEQRIAAFKQACQMVPQLLVPLVVHLQTCVQHLPA
ncbi:hypothetical protein JOB18_021610 [Solea senegalensis]|uniref:UPAR/Ly6 domain-containing protein n=1 Tax=Solea senegalensis TaxID=28829 RepID=A0AAV6SA75_SOLSE|nr:hypothetical protein JOB18_021610 [Solea senegalensis]